MKIGCSETYYMMVTTVQPKLSGGGIVIKKTKECK